MADAAPPAPFSLLGQCYRFLRGWPCDPPRACGGAHLPRALRPPCPRWLATSRTGAPCPYDATNDCFFPHVLPPAARTLRQGVCCALQAPASHAGRLAALLRPLEGGAAADAAGEAAEGGGGGSDDARGLRLPRGASLHLCKAHGSFRRSDALLLVEWGGGGGAPLDAARAWLARVAAAPFLAAALIRVFVCAPTPCATEQDLAAHLSRSLPPRCAARLHCFPRALEGRLVALLEAAQPQAAQPQAAQPQGAQAGIDLVRHGFAHLACVVHVEGAYYAAVEAPGSPAALGLRSAAAASSAPPAQLPQAAPVCRAELKLRELAARLPWLFASAGGGGGGGERAALDVGAAPGGWTACLLTHPALAFTRVFAVDPGELDAAALLRCGAAPVGWEAAAAAGEAGPGAAAPPEAASAAAAAPLPLPLPLPHCQRPRCYTHLRMRGLEAVALLAQRGQRLHAYVCDANVPTLLALECLQAARPLLEPGAPAIVTLKNFDGRAWAGRCQAAAAALAALRCSRVRTLHLFANGCEEVTLVGVCE